MPFLLNEDDAVKRKLQGLKVADANAPVGGRPVTVRFRNPEDELASQTFPLILVARTDMSASPEREHRGTTALMYTPEGVPEWDPAVEDPTTSPYVVDFPIPMDLRYQITVLTRKLLHSTSLTAQLADQSRLPFRFGYLEVPQDGTVRSLFVDGGPEFESTLDRDGKRLFQTHFTIRIPTELLPAVIEQAITAQQVSLGLSAQTN